MYVRGPHFPTIVNGDRSLSNPLILTSPFLQTLRLSLVRDVSRHSSWEKARQQLREKLVNVHDSHWSIDSLVNKKKEDYTVYLYSLILHRIFWNFKIICSISLYTLDEPDRLYPSLIFFTIFWRIWKNCLMFNSATTVHTIAPQLKCSKRFSIKLQIRCGVIQEFEIWIFATNYQNDSKQCFRIIDET